MESNPEELQIFIHPDDFGYFFLSCRRAATVDA